MASAKFEITEPKGLFDGVSLHKQGTILEIEEKDFPVLVRGMGMAPLDELGRRYVHKLNGGKDVRRLVDDMSADPSTKEGMETIVAAQPRLKVVTG